MNKCHTCQQAFENTLEDQKFFQKLAVPQPINCPPCREAKRLAFRNERYYYNNVCALCQKQIISVYNPQHHSNVYCHSCWWSDKWDPQSYGQDFDFQQPFFQQYHQLSNKVPKLAMMNDNGNGSENSEYTYDVAFCKNAYLVIGSWHVQDCSYGFQINHVQDCIDNYFVNESQLMYNCCMCEKCYACQDCINCSDSKNCIFGYDLKGCSDCILSASLRNKQYCIYNKQYSKEDYFRIKESMNLGDYQQREKYRQEFQKFLQHIPKKFANLINCENVTGDNLVNCKNSQNCFNQRNLQDCKFMSNGDGAKDCYDCWSTGGPELCYHCITPDDSYNVAYSIYCWKTKNARYSDNCHSSQDIFGCIGLKRQQYCILNKQYSPENYQELKEKIISHMTQTGEWGQFFPTQISPFAYNETTAHEWYPLDQQTAQNKNYRWQNNLPGSYQKQTINWSQIPTNIKELPQQELSTEIFHCLNCEKNYKIQAKEIRFYKTQNIPLPRLCIDCRYNRRKHLINDRKLFTANCNNCHKTLQTSYSPESLDQIYCEKCYLDKVYFA